MNLLVLWCFTLIVTVSSKGDAANSKPSLADQEDHWEDPFLVHKGQQTVSTKSSRSSKNKKEKAFCVGFFPAPPRRSFVSPRHFNADKNPNKIQKRGVTVIHKTLPSFTISAALALAYTLGSQRSINCYIPTQQDYEKLSNKSIENGWDCSGTGRICEKIWRPIERMLYFHKQMKKSTLKILRNDDKFLAFSRGSEGFFVVSKRGNSLKNFTLNKTGLPKGKYCNLVDDCMTMVEIQKDEKLTIRFSLDTDRMVAICFKCSNDPSIIKGNQTSKAPNDKCGQVGYQIPPPSPKNRTVILIKWPTSMIQQVFIRGGTGISREILCFRDNFNPIYSIPIKHKNWPASFEKMNAWRAGDTRLDWCGAQRGQGRYEGTKALGTPLVWTTNVRSHERYHPLNSYGDHYWILDVEMDCSQTDSGWFQFLTYVTNWDDNAYQTEMDTDQGFCSGTACGKAPFTTFNHAGRCGYVNVFGITPNSCKIDDFGSLSNSEEKTPDASTTVSSTTSVQLSTKTTLSNPTSTSSTSKMEKSTQNSTATTQNPSRYQNTTTTWTDLPTTPVKEPVTTTWTDLATTPVKEPLTTTAKKPPVCGDDLYKFPPPHPTGRTVVFLRQRPGFNQSIFIVGGRLNQSEIECPMVNSGSPYSIRIKHHPINSSAEEVHNAKEWIKGDNYLDWCGDEEGQGVYEKYEKAIGTPLFLTTNIIKSPLYHPLNKYNDNMWMMDVDMNCSQTNQGWFLLTALVTNYNGSETGTERGLSQRNCTGTACGEAPIKSTFHAARCGYINVFSPASPMCVIDGFPSHILKSASSYTADDENLGSAQAILPHEHELDSTTRHPECGDEDFEIPRPHPKNRTVIFIEAATLVRDYRAQVGPSFEGFNFFIRGGNSNETGMQCPEDGGDPPANSIPIKHVLMDFPVPSSMKQKVWAKGDNYLDWCGHETGQGRLQGRKALGTPLVLTKRYIQSMRHPLNVYADNVLVADMEMDCSKTNQGWFFLKLLVTKGTKAGNIGWEKKVQQGLCLGRACGKAPFDTDEFHAGRCGYINVFAAGVKKCIIDSFPSRIPSPTTPTPNFE